MNGRTIELMDGWTKAQKRFRERCEKTRQRQKYKDQTRQRPAAKDARRADKDESTETKPDKDQTKTEVQGPKTREPKTKKHLVLH